MTRKKYNKLVRDKIPEIIKAAGQIPVTHSAAASEFEARLLEKFHEEVREIAADPNKEEVADLLELIYALCDFKGYSLEEIEQLRQKKAKERGGFTQRIILDETQETN